MNDADEKETWVIVGKVPEGEWAIWSARREVRRLARREGNTPAAPRIDIAGDDGRAVTLPALIRGGGTDSGGE